MREQLDFSHEGLRYLLYQTGVDETYLFIGALILAIFVTALFVRVAWGYRDTVLRYTSVVAFALIIGAAFLAMQYVEKTYYPHALLSLNAGYLLIGAWIIYRFYSLGSD